MDRKFSFKLIFSFFAILLFVTQCLAAATKQDAEADILSPETAFKIKVTRINTDTALLTFDIAPGYQLYQEHLQFHTLSGKNFQDKTPHLPNAIEKNDEFLGKYFVYTNRMEIMVPLSVLQQSRGFRVQYQGCAQAGFCYPPIQKQILFAENGHLTISDVSTSQEVDEKTSQKAESEIEKIMQLMSANTIPMTLFAFLGLGILLACTPCVLPMVPILANILVGNKPLSRRRSLYLSSLYIVSMASCYALAGVAAGLLGSQLQASLQQPLLLIGLSMVIFIFAANQLSFINVPMPRIFSDKLQQIEKKQKQGSASGAMIMGALSALMVSPCVTPALVGALTYIGQKGSAWLGGGALFAMALGMGLPLFIVACLGSHFLPKAGPWMKHVKNATGVLLIILAMSILFRAIPSGFFTGSQAIEQSQQFAFTPIRSTTELQQALEQARTLKKPVVIDVYADWCIACRQMDKEVFENKDILQKLADVQVLRIDLTERTKGHQQLQKELGIIGPPMVLFFGLNGEEVKSYRLAGKPASNAFMQHLNEFLSEVTR